MLYHLVCFHLSVPGDPSFFGGQKMWVPTGKDSFLADQEKLKQAEEELRREKNRIIQIERSPAERDRSVYRPPTPEGKEVSKRVIRRRDSTPTLSPTPTKHDRDHRRSSTTRRRSSPSPGRRDRRRSGEKDVHGNSQFFLRDDRKLT